MHDEGEICELVKTGDGLLLKEMVTGRSYPPEWGTTYLFVITIVDPLKIFCIKHAPLYVGWTFIPEGRRRFDEGHFSIPRTLYKDLSDGNPSDIYHQVFYAGQIYFGRGGKLIAWDNASGHYRPSHNHKLLPVHYLVLKPDLFRRFDREIEDPGWCTIL